MSHDQHQSIKALAALQGKSIKDYAVERLLPMTADEAQALQELKALLAPRIDQAMRGEVVEQSLDQILEEVMQEDAGGPA